MGLEPRTNSLLKKHSKNAIVLIAMIPFVVWLPQKPIDPWKLFQLKKIATIIFALSLTQFLGHALNQSFGKRWGAILTGFFGGLVSSTATTAALAKRSLADSSPLALSTALLTFLSATLAMLVEAVVILQFGSADFHLGILGLLLGPLLISILLMIRESHRIGPETLSIQEEQTQFDWSGILKLTAVIVLLLTASKLLQIWVGKNGIYLLTFFVSLFEVHGSLVANTQLFDSQDINLAELGNLAAIAISATYVSKFFLIATLGSPELKKKARSVSLLLMLALGMGWIGFVWLGSTH
jgi:uncharacterized membrane protein (DUF4010 family)